MILTGEGGAFCAGLALEQARTLPDMPAAIMLHEQTSWARAIAGFRYLSKPVIAAVNGAAAGAGMALALAADIRVASSDARFNAALSGSDSPAVTAVPRGCCLAWLGSGAHPRWSSPVASSMRRRRCGSGW